MTTETQGKSVRVRQDKPTIQYWYNRCYGIWMDSESGLLQQHLRAILSEMLEILNAPPRKPGMPKGYHYRVGPCHICGRPMPANRYVQHIKAHHHANREIQNAP